MIKKFNGVAIAGIAITLLTVQGCAKLWISKGLTDDGQATELVFPNIQTDATLKEGLFVNLANLRQMAPGMTKEQIYALLGRPHFREGIGEMREWDYIFNFRNTADSANVTCQYKVLFDKNLKAQNFYWLPASCADKLNPAVK